MSPEEVKQELAGLTAEEAASIYFYRCRGITNKWDLDEVLKRTPGVNIGASSAYTRSREGMRFLRIDDEQLANVYCPVLLEMVGETPDFRNWPPAVETVVTDHPETIEAAGDEEESLPQELEENSTTATEGLWDEIPGTQETETQPPPPPPLIVPRSRSEDFPQERPAWLRLVTIFVTAAVLLGAGAFLLTRLPPGEEEPAFADEPPPTEAVLELGEPNPTQQPAEIASATAAPTSSTPEPALSPTAAHTPSITPTPTNTPTPTATPTATAEPLFADNFTGGISEEWQLAYGDYVIVDGQLVFSDESMLIIGDETWTDYLVSFDVGNLSCQRHIGSTHVYVGMRLRDQENMPSLRLFHYGECAAAWGEIIDWDFELFPNGVTEWTPGTHIEVWAVGSAFDSNKAAEVIIPDYPSGPAAIIASSGLSIDNFSVVSIDEAP